jgi:hypothetical protein
MGRKPHRGGLYICKHGSYYGGVRTHNGNGAAVDIHLGIKKRGSGFCCAGVIFCTKSQPDAMEPLTQGGLKIETPRGGAPFFSTLYLGGTEIKTSGYGDTKQRTHVPTTRHVRVSEVHPSDAARGFSTPLPLLPLPRFQPVAWQRWVLHPHLQAFSVSLAFPPCVCSPVFHGK